MVSFRNFEIKHDEIPVVYKMRDLFCFFAQLFFVVAKLHKQNVYFQAF